MQRIKRRYRRLPPTRARMFVRETKQNSAAGPGEEGAGIRRINQTNHAHAHAHAHTRRADADVFGACAYVFSSVVHTTPAVVSHICTPLSVAPKRRRTETDRATGSCNPSCLKGSCPPVVRRLPVRPSNCAVDVRDRRRGSSLFFLFSSSVLPVVEYKHSPAHRHTQTSSRLSTDSSSFNVTVHAAISVPGRHRINLTAAVRAGNQRARPL